ncbi:MAG: hypothetical protein RLY65_716, partial [Pseudomonadota bacterium]
QVGLIVESGDARDCASGDSRGWVSVDGGLAAWLEFVVPALIA